jgi:quinol monooxygenase YgiN
MNEKYYIVAKFDLPEAHREEVLAAIKTLAAATRKEPGCDYYLFTQDQTNPQTYSFLECWAGEEAFLAHCRTPHYKSFGEFARGKRENMVVHKLKQII